MTSTSAVLYVDHAGHPAPLSLCYHATSSRTLSSSIDDRTDPSTVTEVDSAYCPQCLSFHDAATAASSELRGCCPRPTCRACPVCRSALAVSIGAAPGAAAAAAAAAAEGGSGGGRDVCYYSCGHCRWTSDECGVTGPAPESGKAAAAPGRQEVRAATEGLGNSLRERVAAAGREKGKAGTSPAELYRILVDGWSSQAKEEERWRREGDAAVRGAGRRGGGDGPAGWSVESLEESTQKRREEEGARASAPCVDGIGLGRLGLDDALETTGPSPTPGRPTPDQASAQAVLGPGTVAVAAGSVAALLPLPVPLRPRKSRRCRAELAAGRPGILVKPKVNPLEGDSSLRSGHGQWWKKDSSAIHVVPKVKFVKHGRISSAGSPTRHALLLSVQNPTLGKIRLRLNGADLPEQCSTAAGGEGRLLNNVLIDAMARTCVDATIIRSTSTLVLPDMVELDPVEDAFFELGKGRSRYPEEVERWDFAEVLEGLDGGSKDGAAGPATAECPFRTILVQQDKAWVQLVVTEDDSSPSPSSLGKFVAVPVMLQIEVGDGSWESSLIKPRTVKDGESDLVNISLIIVWKDD